LVRKAIALSSSHGSCARLGSRSAVVGEEAPDTPSTGGAATAAIAVKVNKVRLTKSHRAVILAPIPS